MATGEPGAFGELLRRHRLAAGLTQAALAEQARLSVRAVADLERGARRFPYPDTAQRLAESLRLTAPERAALLEARRRAHSASDLDAPLPITGQRMLPVALTSFIGRECELAAVQERLHATRLLTLTGPGGVGKTRLALEVAGLLTRGSKLCVDGVWQAELAPLADGGQVPRALASSLGVREVPGQPVLETVSRSLHARHMLLILDNCEHLLAASAAAADALLRALSGLTILATSREALNIAGEVVWPVGPLPADSDGLRLFADRASAASPSFEITSDTRSAVVRVCQQLDGLPLAIELAAARVNAFTVDEIERRLEQRFALLTAGRRTSPTRHQTLRALVDWSYELLSVEEQQLLQQVSVFSGGWTFEAAEAVCEPTVDVPGLMPSLVDKSLVQVEQRAGQSRYRLLETLRQYGVEKLREAQAERAARTRHLVWCECLGRAAERELMFGRREMECFQRLEDEFDNFRSALQWSLLEPGQLESGLKLAAALARSSFWYGGYGVEGSEWMDSLLARASPGPGQAEALSERGFLLMRRGDTGAAHPLLEQAVALARQLDDGCLLAVALSHVAEVRMHEGDLVGARLAVEESLALSAEAADCPQYWPRHRVLSLLGEIAEIENDWDAASSFYEQTLEMARALQDQFRSVILRHLGQLALNRGDLSAARARLNESLVVAHQARVGWGVAPTLAHMAGLAMAENQPVRAIRLAGAAAGLREKHRARLLPIDSARLETVIEPARCALGEKGAANAWADGHAMTIDQAVAYALEITLTQPDVTLAAANLTPREMEVTALLARFATNREIATRLVISEGTAKRHVENILMKLGLRSRMQVADWASEHGVLPRTD
jgi:predicted ATPase/DNA-binding CsgD family transcriptional regulator/DNA-binding XRE family transcriptional regulator